MSTAKKYPLPRLKQIMRDNKIKGVTFMNKLEMLKKLNRLGLVPNEVFVAKSEKKATMKEVNSDCSRNNLRKVIVKDLETGLETEYSSIYKAARALDCPTMQIYYRNGKLLSNRYKIDIVG